VCVVCTRFLEHVCRSKILCEYVVENEFSRSLIGWASPEVGMTRKVVRHVLPNGSFDCKVSSMRAFLCSALRQTTPSRRN
jgi:hypothetical protein